MAAGSQRGATSVVERNDKTTAPVSATSPNTRDFPLPPRSVRLGLSTEQPATSRSATSTTTSTAVRRSVSESSVATTVTGTIEPIVVEQEPDETDAAVEARTTQDLPITPGPGGAKRGRHRAGPPNALKARATLAAVAAGAVAAAVGGSGNYSESITADPAPAGPVPVAAADTSADPALAAATDDLDGGAVPAASKADMDGYSDQLTVGKQLAAAAAAREAAARKPLYASPIPLGTYSFTSGYAMRWGSFHGGLDLAAPLGTPIHAVTDGTVVESGPASGYGNWVQVKADDGTITMYGHMASSGVLVQKGQKVTAGDVIALVGSEGFSTGPHLHFEVWKNGSTKIDPAPWLAAKGIKLSAYGG